MLQFIKYILKFTSSLLIEILLGKLNSLLLHHDAGKYWNKSSFIIHPGIIKISTLNLNYNSDSDTLQKNIEKHFNLQE